MRFYFWQLPNLRSCERQPHNICGLEDSLQFVADESGFSIRDGCKAPGKDTVFRPCLDSLLPRMPCFQPRRWKLGFGFFWICIALCILLHLLVPLFHYSWEFCTKIQVFDWQAPNAKTMIWDASGLCIDQNPSLSNASKCANYHSTDGYWSSVQ